MISLGLNMVGNSWCDVSQQNKLIYIKGLLFLDILMQDSYVLYFWFPMPSKDNPVKLNVLKTLEKGPNKSTLCNCFEVLSKFSGVLLSSLLWLTVAIVDFTRLTSWQLFLPSTWLKNWVTKLRSVPPFLSWLWLDNWVYNKGAVCDLLYH